LTLIAGPSLSQARVARGLTALLAGRGKPCRVRNVETEVTTTALAVLS